MIDTDQCIAKARAFFEDEAKPVLLAKARAVLLALGDATAEETEDFMQLYERRLQKDWDKQVVRLRAWLSRDGAMLQ